MYVSSQLYKQCLDAGISKIKKSFKRLIELQAQ